LSDATASSGAYSEKGSVPSLPSYSVFRDGDLSQHIDLSESTFPDQEVAASIFASTAASTSDIKAEAKPQHEIDESFLDRIKFAIAVLQQVI